MPNKNVNEAVVYFEERKLKKQSANKGRVSALSKNLRNFQQNKEAKMERIRQELPDELEDCTFEPKLNKSRNKTPDALSNRPFTERLTFD